MINVGDKVRVLSDCYANAARDPIRKNDIREVVEVCKHQDGTTFGYEVQWDENDHLFYSLENVEKAEEHSFPFDVGDKVEITNHHSFRDGVIGVIKYIDVTDPCMPYQVEVEEEVFWCSYSHLTKVEERRFQIGDTVRYVGKNYEDKLLNGQNYKILSVDEKDSTYPYEIINSQGTASWWMDGSQLQPVEEPEPTASKPRRFKRGDQVASISMPGGLIYTITHRRGNQVKVEGSDHWWSADAFILHKARPKFRVGQLVVLNSPFGYDNRICRVLEVIDDRRKLDNGEVVYISRLSPYQHRFSTKKNKKR